MHRLQQNLKVKSAAQKIDIPTFSLWYFGYCFSYGSTQIKSRQREQ
jgi:hypothetical protein